MDTKPRAEEWHPGPPRGRLRVVRRSCAAITVGLAIAISGSRASAEESERIAVSYEAHPLCPNEDAFVGEISARTSKFRRVPPAEAGRTIHVRLSEEPGHAMTRGELLLAEGDSESTRVVHDENCSVVVSGLALIAALAIDPEAETGPVDPLVHSPPPAPPPPVAPPAPPRDVAPPPLPPRPSRWQLGASLGVAGRAGLVPLTAAVTIAGFVGRESPSLVHPHARIELSAGAPRTESAGGPAADLQWFGGRVEGCGLLGRRFRAGPCGLVEVGAVHARGVDVSDAQSTTRVGFATGAGARAMLMAGHVQAGIGAFVVIPFRRDRFYVDAPRQGTVTVFQSSAVGGQVGADVGMVF